METGPYRKNNGTSLENVKKLVGNEENVVYLKGHLPESISGINIDREFAVVHYNMGPTWSVREWQFSKWESLVELLKKQLGLQIIQVGAEFVSSSGGRPTPGTGAVYLF